MRIQRFKGRHKDTGKIIDRLQIYELYSKVRFIKDLYWDDPDLNEYSVAETYELDEFDRLEEYFEEIEVPEETKYGPDWIVKAQTAK